MSSSSSSDTNTLRRPNISKLNKVTENTPTKQTNKKVMKHTLKKPTQSGERYKKTTLDYQGSYEDVTHKKRKLTQTLLISFILQIAITRVTI